MQQDKNTLSIIKVVKVSSNLVIIDFAVKILKISVGKLNINDLDIQVHQVGVCKGK